MSNSQLFKSFRYMWIHEHPTTVKVLEVALLILGIGLLILPSVFVLGIGSVVCLGLTGGLFTLAAALALLALDILVPPHYDMSTHVYSPGQCEGGRLYYDGDIPILSLDSDDPFKAGKAHGYLCGDAISRLSKRFGLVLHTLAGRPRASRLPNTLALIRNVIPQEYLREIEGLVEGYNEWAKEQSWWQFPNSLTVDDALLFHLMPDSLHFDPSVLEEGVKEGTFNELAFGCSAVVDHDPQKGFIFARNMDWPSFGLSGAYTLIINRKHANELLSTVEVGVPGLIGTLTGMNSQGLAIAMNVCSGNTKNIRGLPAVLYNRACLEKCATVEDIEEFIENESPLGSYHLTAVDKEGAEAIHFYQSPEGTHVKRPFEENHPLYTLNCRYSPEPNCPMHYSDERAQEIDKFFQNRENRPLEDVLSLPYINNWITTHRVVMEPLTGTIRVGFDNAYAGRTPLHTVPALV